MRGQLEVIVTNLNQNTQGTTKKANNLTNAERCRRSRKKRKQEDPDCYKVKSAVDSKNHYNKNKNKSQFRFKKQKNSLLSYYKKEQKENCSLKL